MAKRTSDIHLKKQYAVLALRWCKHFFGENDRKRSKLQFEFTKRIRTLKGHLVYGNYCFYRNKMTIHEPTCKTLYDIVSTVIHEYTHYLQSRTLYKTYQDNYYYSTNPYEREAKRNEEKYTRMCIRYIKSCL
jgi:Zn-dependent peptidase ImmA (M78 family)